MVRVSFRLAPLFALVFCLVFSTSAFAQSDTATIAGHVKDSSGALVPGAQVTVTNEATGLQRTAQSNQAGYYVVASLPPGFYTVMVEAAGFKRFTKTQNKLDPNVPATVDANLQLGTVSEVVEVVASGAIMQTETPTLGKLIEGKLISDSQLNGRNPILLALLKPGVRGGSLAGLSFGVTSGGFSINGSRSQDNLITFDGSVGIRTRSNGTSIGVADLDSVQEVQVLTANYGAEYGRSAGGQIRIVTKSGTRTLHGSAYEYFRNSALNANSWARNLSSTTNFPPPERFNQFGYTIGGPVYIPKLVTSKEKAFFFFSQEWLRRRTAATNARVVPSLAMRNGDFSELLNPVNDFFNGARFIKDPLLTGACTANDRTACFPGNIIPAGRRTTNGLGLLRVYPDPTPGFRQGTNNWLGSAAVPTNHRKETMSLDIIPTSKHSLRLRGTNYSFVDPNPFQSGFLHFTRIFDRPNQTGSVNWTYTVSPSLVNEFVVSASRDQVYIDVDTSSGLYDRTRYGINYPFAFPGTKDLPNKIPAVDIPGFSSYTGSPYPSFSTGPIYNIANNTTKIKGNHTIKFGILWERAGQNDYDQINVQGVPGGTDNQNGRFVFSDTRVGGSGLAIADVMLGLYNTYAEIGTRSYTPYRGHMWEWFVQDGWKVRPNLRVDIGLRHTIIQPYYSLWRNMTVFDPRYYDPAKAVSVDPRTGNPISGAGDPYNGVVIPGSGWPDSAKGRVPIATSGAFDRLFRGEPKQYSDVHYKDFQPRIGFAYSVNPRTVIRAGAGKFVTRLGVSDSIFLGGNAPLQPLASFSLGSVDNPAGGSGSNFPLSVNTQDKVFQNPMAYTWNTTVEREVRFNTTVELSYVGRVGLRGQREKNINQLLPGTIQANPGINENALRPFKGFGQIRLTNNEARSVYHSLQIGANRRYSKGLAFGVAYTLSKSDDNGSAQRDVIPNAYDDRFIWGPSSFDTRHILVINWIYDLPFFKDMSRLSGKLLGGWKITGVTQFQTGTPITIQTADDIAGVGSGSGNETFRATILNVSGNPVLDRGKKAFATSAGANAFWFMPCQAPPCTASSINPATPAADPTKQLFFTFPAPGTFTTQRNRGMFHNPGFQNWNLGLFKDFHLTERQYITLRAEFFNWPNHPNWNGANNDPRSATFGKVTGKSSERNIQFSLRYSF